MDSKAKVKYYPMSVTDTKFHLQYIIYLTEEQHTEVLKDVNVLKPYIDSVRSQCTVKEGMVKSHGKSIENVQNDAVLDQTPTKSPPKKRPRKSLDSPREDTLPSSQAPHAEEAQPGLTMPVTRQDNDEVSNVLSGSGQGVGSWFESLPDSEDCILSLATATSESVLKKENLNPQQLAIGTHSNQEDSSPLSSSASKVSAIKENVNQASNDDIRVRDASVEAASESAAGSSGPGEWKLSYVVSQYGSQLIALPCYTAPIPRDYR